MENNIIHTAITKTGKTVSFRYPTIKDAKGMMNYINKLSKEKTYILMQGGQKTLEDEKKWLQSFLDHRDRSLIILAFYKDKVIGISDISLKDEAKKCVGSFGLSVAKDFRGEGIGKILMELVIKESIRKMKDLKIIDLEVFGDNLIAQNLYKKLGFKEYGRLPKCLKRLGKFSDAILMYKKVK